MSTSGAPSGFTYEVSDEQLRAFRSRSPDERLRWLEETRELMYALAPEETRRRWAELRQASAKFVRASQSRT